MKAELEKQAEDLQDNKEDYKRENMKIEENLKLCEKVAKKREDEDKAYSSRIHKHEKAIEKMQEMMIEREDVIEKKENNVSELRNYNKHLEIFRYVLDH